MKSDARDSRDLLSQTKLALDAFTEQSKSLQACSFYIYLHEADDNGTKQPKGYLPFFEAQSHHAT